MKKLLLQNLEYPFELIGTDWMLITAGDKNKFNTMTASWGTLGVLWNKKIATCFVRPQRYTFEFIEKQNYFSLSFFNSSYKDALKLCGTKSGRDIDKVKETGLTPCFEESAPYFSEAHTTLVCKKIYSDFISPKCIIDKSIESNYQNKDYHKMYIGEIIKCVVKE